MADEVIIAGKARMWMGKDGIVRQIFYPKAEIYLEETKEAFEMRIKLSNGKKHPFFIDVTNLKTISRDSRVFGTSDEVRDLTSAMAILTGSSIGKVIGNFFIGINRPSYPTKLFTSESEAINWLQGFAE